MFGFWVRAAGTNLGGFMSPIVVGSLAKYYGWQWGMW
jgi:dipeptide/tripeptide permease